MGKTRKMRLVAFLKTGPTAHHHGMWRHPDDPDILSNEAFLRCASGDLSGGEKCLLELLQGKASARADRRLRSVAHFNLGLIYQQRKRHAEAEAQYRAALAIDPGYTDAKNNLAILLGSGAR